ncbi:MAG: trimeric autotransporter adhesin, partial [Sphingomonadales bacterium]|nr:trimeric autotransporter adhesin [Sphingomonadales bacterium]
TVAVGAGSVASGNQSVAMGNNAKATNGAAVSIGAGNTASGNGAVAIGDPNTATGTGAVAVGDNNTATGTGAVAVGAGNTANGNGAVALGNGSSATGANSVALGGGTATRAGQIALGTAGSTYSMSGLSSAASTAAQSGPTRFITSDAGGNLGYSSFGPADIAGLTSRLDAVDTRFGVVEGRLALDERRANGGIAMAMALGGTIMPPDSTIAVSFNLATYRGQQGFSASGVARLAPHVWANAGIAGSTVRGSTGGRAGVTLGW